MARNDDNNPARFDSLHELLARAEALGLHVSLNVHSVPSEELLEWVQIGLLDGIEQGAGTAAHRNPPTGTLEGGSHLGGGKTEASCFMEDAAERERRIRREEDAAVAALAASLHVDEEEVA